MKLIIGLGNPGAQYANTWHNLGFLALDLIRREFDFEKFKPQAKLRAEISTGKIGREKIILVKPQTFMNDSGAAVGAALKYFKAKLTEIIVIHDDLDLPLGKLRLAQNSSAGGHNGIKSIIQALDAQNFIRIKIGIKTAKAEKIVAEKYVLEKIGRAQTETVFLTVKKAALATETIIASGLAAGMNEFN